jgi:hypothetical protein
MDGYHHYNGMSHLENATLLSIQRFSLTIHNVYVFVFWYCFVVAYVSKKARLGAEEQRWKKRLRRYSFAERIIINSSTDL